MKHLATLIAALAISAVTLAAQSPFSAYGTKVSTNACYAVVKAKNGQPAVNFVEAIVASASSSATALNFLSAGSPITITNALAAGSSNILCATSGLVPGKDILLRYGTTGNYQWSKIQYTNGTGIGITNLIGVGVTDEALVAGDRFYVMTTNHVITIGAADKTYNGGSIVFASDTADRPLLILTTITGTATNINSLLVSGEYR